MSGLCETLVQLGHARLQPSESVLHLAEHGTTPLRQAQLSFLMKLVA